MSWVCWTSWRGCWGMRSLPPRTTPSCSRCCCARRIWDTYRRALTASSVTTAGRMRLPETDAVFVVGLLEGEFPTDARRPGAFDPRRPRPDDGVRGPNCPTALPIKSCAKASAFTRPSRRRSGSILWLSWPAAAHAEDTAPASAALAPVLQYLHVAALVQPTAGAAGGGPRRRAGCARRADPGPRPRAPPVPPSAPRWTKAAKTGELSTGYAAVRTRCPGRPPMRPPTRQNTAALEALLGPGAAHQPDPVRKIPDTAPSATFCSTFLRAAPRQKAELAPNISGTLTHWVLENALRRQGAAFKDLTPEELETLVNESGGRVHRRQPARRDTAHGVP